jgi:hypothetical protein
MLQNLLRIPEETAEPYPKDANAIQYVYEYMYICVYMFISIHVCVY